MATKKYNVNINPVEGNHDSEFVVFFWNEEDNHIKALSGNNIDTKREKFARKIKRILERELNK